MSRTSKNTKLKDSLINTVMLRLAVISAINISMVSALCTFFYIADRNVYEEYTLILIAFFAADFLSAYYIGKKIKEKGMLYGILYNIPLIVLFTAISLAFNNLTFDSRLFILPVIRIIASAIGGITAVNSKSRNKRK